MNRTAFVTGADRGLGLALVAALMQRHWTVVAGHLERVPSDLENLGDLGSGALHAVPAK